MSKDQYNAIIHLVWVVLMVVGMFNSDGWVSGIFFVMFIIDFILFIWYDRKVRKFWKHGVTLKNVDRDV